MSEVNVLYFQAFSFAPDVGLIAVGGEDGYLRIIEPLTEKYADSFEESALSKPADAIEYHSDLRTATQLTLGL